ncbi:hypothetical protein EV193_105117 [Herbihabitans rhizosphaerae]|uniref:LppP/LprE lipoprotein n=1 Tax=Herbihabitans rhizosphaerae TaxID=1872711 RepID=A0A4Q7KPF0_9PSEU|nr:hypothetical protein [Herbihabitans rhizosphaerae]RZS37561.1 hypothetical protein EV193_105117 [Herbihabitans rhizosphaerae]
MSRPTMRALGAALATGLVVLAGCASTVSGQGSPADGGAPRPGGPSGEAPKPGENKPAYMKEAEQVAAALPATRGWDVCAMHDLPALQRASQGTAAWIAPLSSVSSCDVSLRDGAGKETITAKLEVKVELTGDWETGKINGVPVFRAKPVPGAPAFGVSCPHAFPVKAPLVVKLDITSVSNPPRDAMCTMTEKYFTDLLPTLQNPPAAGSSQPRISLYGKDPCAALAPIAAVAPVSRKGEPRFLVPTAAYACEWRTKSEPGYVSIEFSSLMDEGGQRVRFGNLTGFRKPGGMDCEYRVPVDPPINFKPGQSPIELGITIKMEKCDDAAAGQAVASVVSQSPAPSTGQAKPVRLGAL